MNPSHSTYSTRIKVGIFTVLGIVLVGAITVFVNDKPNWWKPCQLVSINVEDATGLKPNSPIRSLGLEIGYLETVALSETHVTLGICITSPVEVLPTTRAYIRGEGFLGDKFVELKPVRYLGSHQGPGGTDSTIKPDNPGLTPGNTSILEGPSPDKEDARLPAGETSLLMKLWELAGPTAAYAADPVRRTAQPGNGREIPVGEGEDVQQMMKRVDDLVKEVTGLTNNLRDAINPDQLRDTMKQLNKTLESASKTLAPEGGLNQTAQRTLAKLEDAIEQLRDQMTRVNRGEGSVGMLLNDPSYADEIRQAIRNVNMLLSRVGGVRFHVDVGAEEISVYNGGRGWFQLNIWPEPDRYYLVGISVDPRGKVTDRTVTTTVGGVQQVTTVREVEDKGILLTGMLGKVYLRRFDFAIGALHGDGAIRFRLNLGPGFSEERVALSSELYTRIGAGAGADGRFTLTVNPWLGIYVKAGIESIRGVDGKIPYSYGAGVAFDDQDIKLLFALR